MNQIVNRLKSLHFSGLKVLTLALVILTPTLLKAQDAAAGEKLFTENCTSCHAINDKVTGPALKDVHKRRNEAWLIKWIKNSQAMVKSGDPEAVKLFEENNNVVMNTFANFSDADVKNIIAYIARESNAPVSLGNTGGGGGEGAGVVAPPVEDTGLIKNINWVLIIIAGLILVIVLLAFEVLNLFSAYTGRAIIRWNAINAALMLLFLIGGMAAAFWELDVHGKLLLPESSTEHGVGLDKMFNTTLIFTGIVFIITQILLFYYSFRYKHNKDRRAFYFPHNNRLEYVWTLIPAVALTFMILAGFKNWTKITSDPDPKTPQIEIFAFQFGWNARYPGADGELGKSNFNLISPTNELGLGIEKEFQALTDSTLSEISVLEKNIAAMESANRLNDAEKAELYELKDQLYRKQAHVKRMAVLKTDSTLFNEKGMDDIITKEIHLPVNKEVVFKFRARDVIHSAYVPHFRMQMNVVPGLPTQFAFTPTRTTAEMRDELKDPKFEYYMICAKICGASHFNMRIKVVVESEADYNKWLASQTAYFAAKGTPAEAPLSSAADSALKQAADTTKTLSEPESPKDLHEIKTPIQGQEDQKPKH